MIQTKYSRLSSVDQACSEWEIWVACIMEVEWVGAVTVPAVSTFNLVKSEEKTAHLAKSVLPRGEKQVLYHLCVHIIIRLSET